MLVDSHCHLNFPELSDNIEAVRALMAESQVGHALCVSVTLDKVHEVLTLAENYENLYASVGVHPDYENIEEPTVDTLVKLAEPPTGGSHWRNWAGLFQADRGFRVATRALSDTYSCCDYCQ